MNVQIEDIVRYQGINKLNEMIQNMTHLAPQYFVFQKFILKYLKQIIEGVSSVKYWLIHFNIVNKNFTHTNSSMMQ